MKICNCVFSFGAFLGAFSLSHAVSIEYAFTDFLRTEQFQRISEYFTGQERAGSRTLLRSNPDQRSGMYFIFKLSEPVGDTLLTEVEVEVIPGDRRESVTHRFTLDGADRRGHWIYCGLTGDDWAEGIQPLSWVVRLLTPQGVLAEHHSFLHRMP